MDSFLALLFPGFTQKLYILIFSCYSFRLLGFFCFQVGHISVSFKGKVKYINKMMHETGQQ